ncbi:hypothetical protein V8G54_009685 [Vigna mungo]|uniref:DUF8039 domain-containing protein n=1 Tax=Vigna mungo TaxID=3915 RepID=A0AAQ3NYH3_VIGMU
MADHPHSSGDEAPPSRSTRGPTRMKQILIRKNSGERTPVNVNVITGVATSPNADDFRSYLGVVALDRISVLTPSFHHVFEVDRNIIWNGILAIRSKAQETSVQNKNPHLLSRGGYRKLEEKILKQKANARSPSKGGSPQPPFSHSRHEKWKLARMKPSGTYFSDTTREISERISSQGQLTPEGRQDILIAAIGRPEHHGRVRAAGTGVGIQDYFGSSSRQTSYAYNKAQQQRLTQEITKKLRANLRGETELRTELRDELYNEVYAMFQQQFESCGMRPMSSPGEVGKEVVQHQLSQGMTWTMLVHLVEQCLKATTIVHGMELSEDELKVLVDEFIIPDASVPLPTDEIFTVAYAFQSFIAWPKQLTHAQEKIPLFEDDRHGSLQLLADILKNKPLEVEYDANVVGRGSEVPLYLHSQDVRELASGTEELNITLVQLWMMYMFGISNNLGYNDDYGFIDPQVIHETNDFDQITTHLTRRFASSKKIYFMPYISGKKSDMTKKRADPQLQKALGVRRSSNESVVDDTMVTCSRLDENCRRIMEVVTRKSKRNPLLMGVYVKSTLKSFIECVEARKGGVLPCELNGLSVVSMEKEIGDFLRQGGNKVVVQGEGGRKVGKS